MLLPAAEEEKIEIRREARQKEVKQLEQIQRDLQLKRKAVEAHFDAKLRQREIDIQLREAEIELETQLWQKELDAVSNL